MGRCIDADTLKIPSEEMVAKMIINSAPHINIIWCKECKHHFYDESNDCKMCYIHEYGEIWEDNDYCSYGEREGE